MNKTEQTSLTPLYAQTFQAQVISSYGDGVLYTTVKSIRLRKSMHPMRTFDSTSLSTVVVKS